MEDAVVRLESIEIRNFKNVEYGYLNFENPRKPYRSSILGLYGQNGSGKTALVDAVALLKAALSGRSVPAHFADYIHVKAECAVLKYGFKVLTHSAQYFVTYEFSLRKDLDESEQNIDPDNFVQERYKATLFNEILSYSYECDDQKVKMQPVINTSVQEVFGPSTKYNLLVGKNPTIFTDLSVAKKLAAVTSRSFVFSKELLSTIRKHFQQEKEAMLPNQYHLLLLESLSFYGSHSIFVIDTSNSGLISMNVLPLAFHYQESNRLSFGNFAISLNKSSVIPQDTVEIVKKVIANMNIVLQQIIPGLTIDVRELGNQLLPNGIQGCQIEFVSQKNSKEIPLRYESEGIKKIISILQLLICVYNQSSITVAIDELDSGVFEYLLGELLRIISEKGKGQLIFTSHNLRPLETLDRGFIAFTTTNPQNRYIRLNNLKTNNNLRDFYYRDIVLGERKESVYERTNNSEIALAFREAGDYHGS